MSSYPPACKMSNVEFVVELMQFSRYGVLAQLFIMDAIIKYSTVVAAVDDPTPYTSALIDGRRWVECARDIKRQLDEFYGDEFNAQRPH